jgi:hypothetical protein
MQQPQQQRVVDQNREIYQPWQEESLYPQAAEATTCFRTLADEDYEPTSTIPFSISSTSFESGNTPTQTTNIYQVPLLEKQFLILKNDRSLTQPSKPDNKHIMSTPIVFVSCTTDMQEVESLHREDIESFTEVPSAQPTTLYKT